MSNEFTARVRRRTQNLLPLLATATGTAEEDCRDGDAALFAATRDLLQTVDAALAQGWTGETDEVEAPATAPAPAARAEAKSGGHRHKYNDGRCIVDGCGALSREARRQLALGPQVLHRERDKGVAFCGAAEAQGAKLQGTWDGISCGICAGVAQREGLDLTGAKLRTGAAS